jgi:hypothetical protein
MKKGSPTPSSTKDRQRSGQNYQLFKDSLNNPKSLNNLVQFIKTWDGKIPDMTRNQLLTKYERDTSRL